MTCKRTHDLMRQHGWRDVTAQANAKTDELNADERELCEREPWREYIPHERLPVGATYWQNPNGVDFSNDIITCYDDPTFDEQFITVVRSFDELTQLDLTAT